ncbi:hypothetical protein FB45DRAFT_27302 [Roridomyces roridus]|uniref:Transmembrane protein n=1 Tax=Roridomyces roridus TaxID=1738132 RepID=A0AAD7CKN6_9AGAR|nr:hypothetical protein FB45DRAFT_27302 [Roridomyces roridus]
MVHNVFVLFILSAVLNGSLYIVNGYQLFTLLYKTKNPAWVRLPVWFIFAVDSLQIVVLMYSLIVRGCGSPGVLFGVGWVMPFAEVATSTIALATQCVLASRGVAVRRTWRCVFEVVPVAPTIVSAWFLLAFGCSITSVVFKHKFSVMILRLGVRMVADLLLMTFLVFVFARTRQTSEYRATRTDLRNLIHRAIGTGVVPIFLSSISASPLSQGLFTCAFTLATLVTVVVVRNANLNAFFVFLMARVYMLTFLNSLNMRASRTEYRDGDKEFVPIGGPLPMSPTNENDDVEQEHTTETMTEVEFFESRQVHPFDTNIEKCEAEGSDIGLEGHMYLREWF